MEKNVQMKSKLVVPLIAVAMVVGIGASALSAFAETDTTSATAPTSVAAPDASRPANDPSKGGHVANGVTETLLTGDTAEKVKAAALVAVPGGTVERVETDAEGAAYEAHMVASDGSHVTVKFDSSYAVTATEKGPTGGARP